MATQRRTTRQAGKILSADNRTKSRYEFDDDNRAARLRNKARNRFFERVEFLRRVVAELELDGVEIFHGRAEELARQKIFREQFDAVTSRAVARLNFLAEYCLPFVKVGGKFIALKGKSFREELDEAQSAIKILGGGEIFVREMSLPTLDEKRAVIYVSKKKSTPEKFPRRESLIRKNFLGRTN